MQRNRFFSVSERLFRRPIPTSCGNYFMPFLFCARLFNRLAVNVTSDGRSQLAHIRYELSIYPQ